tara:strand:- start:157 stop:306 length:150 start_codon:yes stop_codon:yes gene_type:complete
MTITDAPARKHTAPRKIRMVRSWPLEVEGGESVVDGAVLGEFFLGEAMV